MFNGFTIVYSIDIVDMLSIIYIVNILTRAENNVSRYVLFHDSVEYLGIVER